MHFGYYPKGAANPVFSFFWAATSVILSMKKRSVSSSRFAVECVTTDRLLIGFDLVKDHQVLFDAYNDKAGVTAEFNKNLLVRINRELGGDFKLNLFDHYAPFVEEHSRIEMRLISRCNQAVHVECLGQTFDFEKGEYIHTENSYKYTLDSFSSLCEAAGLKMQKHYLDKRGWFAVGLFRKAGGE